MIVVLTGAGISKASGIPTFEEQGDLRSKLSRTYALEHREEYNKIISDMKNICDKAEPNDAHKALAEYNVPIITMNIDGLHRRAGSKNILAVHGELPDIILYGDPAPRYYKAYNWVETLDVNDVFIIVGTSFFTNIASELKYRAELVCVNTIVINSNAETELRKVLEEHKDKIEDFETLEYRVELLYK